MAPCIPRWLCCCICVLLPLPRSHLQADATAKGGKCNRLFYLALPPTVFKLVAQPINHVGRPTGSSAGWLRVVVEKPFGRDSASSSALSKILAEAFSEEEIYRIDHYLGKEMVQNLMVLRFANAVFEPVWNRHHINCVIITFKEPFGTEGRGAYFEHSGIIRDVMQNHLMQVLSLVAMETPTSLEAEAIRDEKVKVLRAIPQLKREDVVLGQYTRNASKTLPAYTDDDDVPADSTTPTFATAVLRIANPRWAGVPFVLKCGKSLNERKAEIRIQFRDVPNALFGSPATAAWVGGTPTAAACAIASPHADPQRPGSIAHNNELVIRIQPQEAMYLKVMCKAPGLMTNPIETELNLSYSNRYNLQRTPEAYARLLLDVLRGDHSQFVRSDELAAAWRIFTPLLHELDDTRERPVLYPYGSRGPPESDALLRSVGYRYEGSYAGEWRARMSPEAGREAIATVRREFSLTAPQMRLLRGRFLREMHAGLQGEHSTIRMLPSFVTRLPDGSERGTVWAVDMGGSNLRVVKFELQGEGRSRAVSEFKTTIPDQLQRGSGKALFDHVAKSIIEAGVRSGDVLGFTFSFPIQQSSVASGTLLAWTKGFSASGVEGEEVVGLLGDALRRAGVNDVHVAALVNDTVGTLMARRYSEPKTIMGVILGTGTNAAYVERAAAASTWHGPRDVPLVINMEWGGFGGGSGGSALLPLTDVDQQIDAYTPNVGDQRFEKMISGYYLGEIFRHLVLFLHDSGALFQRAAIEAATAAAMGSLTPASVATPMHPSAGPRSRGNTAASEDLALTAPQEHSRAVPHSSPIRKRWALQTELLSRLAADNSSGLDEVRRICVDELKVPAMSMDDAKLMQEVANLVVRRAAYLAAVGVSAVVVQLGADVCESSVVGIDGSLFSKHPLFESWMMEALRLLGTPVTLSQALDGSGLGAAIIGQLYTEE